ncbi:MAG TPA: glycosyltransferase family 2 protein [Mycobacteriales bacterium]|nr:glycosyltransferase family 2 protein [Mycobacteriales bacterium]
MTSATARHRAAETPEVTVLLPCLDEARTVATCVRKAHACLQAMNVAHEVLVADNGSSDGSREIAQAAGARVVEVPRRGYGAALRAGIQSAQGRYVVMADADDSYALERIEPFVTALRNGSDLVMGNRFAGGVAPGAMPALHRYLGNPVLSFLGRRFFRIPIRDFHCGLRAFDRDKALAVDLRSDGMEFASELVVKFALSGHRISEVPTTLRIDGRDRKPHLRSWRDGWRHLRFLLLFSPRWLFLYPGAVLAGVGGVLMMRLAFGPLRLGGVVLDTQSLLFSSAAVAVGVQAILFAVLSRTYATARGMLPPRLRRTNRGSPLSLERGVVAGLALLTLGALGFLVAISRWASHDFGPLQLADSMQLAIPAATCLTIGAQVLLASFFLGLLHLDETVSGEPSDAEAAAAERDR